MVLDVVAQSTYHQTDPMPHRAATVGRPLGHVAPQVPGMVLYSESGTRAGVLHIRLVYFFQNSSIFRRNCIRRFWCLWVMYIFVIGVRIGVGIKANLKHCAEEGS